MRYFLQLAYKGTAYHGWQHQPNGVSVQDVVEQALSIILRTPIALTAAGRTDAGVHADKMIAHFDTEISLPDNLVPRLNHLLPPDIAVQTIRRVRDDAHARFDAVSRRYEYRVITRKSAFLTDTTTLVSDKMDFARMNEAAALLLQHTDFASFCKVHTDAKTTICHVRQAAWSERQLALPIGESYSCWVFTIEADRFLRNMVRAIVGTLFDVGMGKLSIEQFEQIIEARNRCAARQSAPAQGLSLVDVGYSDDIYTF